MCRFRIRTNSGDGAHAAGGGGLQQEQTYPDVNIASAQSDRLSIIQATRNQIHHRIRQIIELAIQHTDHIPVKPFEFEITVSTSRDLPGFREAGGGSIVSKLLSTKGLFDNLS